MWSVQFSLLRADAILKSYVLPILDPPSPEVQHVADGVRKMAEQLTQVAKDDFGVVFDDVQLMSPPQPHSADYIQRQDEVERWLPFVQHGGRENAEVKNILVKLYRYIIPELEKDDSRLAADEQSGRLDREKFDSYLRVTDVLRWGYTRDGIRECPTEVVTTLGTRSMVHNLGPAKLDS